MQKSSSLWTGMLVLGALGGCGGGSSAAALEHPEPARAPADSGDRPVEATSGEDSTAAVTPCEEVATDGAVYVQVQRQTTRYPSARSNVDEAVTLPEWLRLVSQPPLGNPYC